MESGSMLAFNNLVFNHNSSPTITICKKLLLNKKIYIWEGLKITFAHLTKGANPSFIFNGSISLTNMWGRFGVTNTKRPISLALHSYWRVFSFFGIHEKSHWATKNGQTGEKEIMLGGACLFFQPTKVACMDQSFQSLIFAPFVFP